MPRDSVHPDYAAMVDKWRRCRDVADGEDAVKAAGSKYLPRLEGQESKDYDAYKVRAMFYGAVGRTIQGLTGMVMRRSPEIGFVEREKDLLESVGINGESLDLYAKLVLGEVLTVGRVGLWVDADGEDVPYAISYSAEQVINWKTEIIKGRRVLTLVVLHEWEEGAGEDRFEHTYADRYRFLELRPAGVDSTGEEQWVYQVEVWERREEEMEKGKIDVRWVQIGETVEPRKVGGWTFDRIPFVFVNATGVSTETEKPPLLDLVNVNLSHYRNSADLEHGRHFTALPTAWLAGWDTNQQLKLGSQVAWVTDNAEASAGFLEFSGSGLGHLQQGMESKEKLMAVLGARLLEEQKKSAEAAETVKLRQSGDASVLSNVAGSVSEGLSIILQFIADWMRLTDQLDSIYVKLNTDFDTKGLDPRTIIALMQAVQNGTMSWKVFFHNAKRAEMYPDDWTEDDERAAIEESVSGAIGQPFNEEESPAQTGEE